MLNFFFGITLIITGFALIGFWIYFFLVENKNPERTDVYLGYERSFPVPDLLWLTPCCFIGGIGLLLGDQLLGIFFSITAGSSLIFLGLLDISFNIQNGGYTTKKSDTIMNIMINLLSLVFGIILLIFGWTSLI